MLDLMSSIIMEGDGVTQELLDSILINLIPAHKVCIVSKYKRSVYLKKSAIGLFLLRFYIRIPILMLESVYIV